MKTKTRKIILSLLVSAFCFVLALFVNVLPKTHTVAEETSVFEMVDGAGIRYGNGTNDDMGIRFRVKMSADVKAQVEEGSATLGFVISLTEYFDLVTDGQYINVAPKLNVENLVVSVDKIYEGEGDEAGYFYANGVIVGMFEKNLVKNYSCIAYLKSGEEYAYAGTPVSRSVQLVASRIYFDSQEDWGKIVKNYAKMGTADMPIIIEKDGEYNTYANLMASVKNGETHEGVSFALTENLLLEEKLGADFAGSFVDNGFTATTFAEIAAPIENDAFALAKVVAPKYNLAPVYNTELGPIYYDETEQAVAISSNKASEPVDVYVNPKLSKAEYEQMKAEGYQYLTFKVKVSSNSNEVRLSSTYINHYNVIKSGAEGAKSSMIAAINGDTTKENRHILGAWGCGKDWNEISVPLDWIMDDYRNNSIGHLRVWPMYDAKQVLYIGGIYATKCGVVAHNESFHPDSVNLTMGSVVPITTGVNFTGSIISDTTNQGERNIVLDTGTQGYTGYSLGFDIAENTCYHNILAQGYQYVTIKIKTPSTGKNIYIAQQSVSHYNELENTKKEKEELATNSGVVLVDGENPGADRYHLGTWGLGASDSTQFIYREFSFPISLLTSQGSNFSIEIWLGWCAKGNTQIDIAGVYLTKDGTLAGNTAS